MPFVFTAASLLLSASAALSADVPADCGGTYNVGDLSEGDRFVFTSHDDFGRRKSKYAADTECARTFQKGSCDRLSFTCDAFDVAGSGRNCKTGDKVDFDNGDDVSSKVCGKAFEPIKTSSSDDLTVTFTSDGRQQKTGFQCYATCETIVNVPCFCGQRPSELIANGRIVGGDEATVNDLPWQAGIVYKKLDSPYCGGTVIGDRWILTAAHCFGKNTKPSGVRVALGDHDHTTREETDEMFIFAKRIIRHEDYNSKTSDNDYALIELETAIDFTMHPQIRPACLPTAPADTTQTATVSGWGNLSGKKDKFPEVLHEVDVPLIDHAVCRAHPIFNFGDVSEITDNMLCAGDIESGRIDSCQGDSGGPLVVKNGDNYEVAGVVSFGYGCADKQSPGVYADVYAALDWINANAGFNTDQCPRSGIQMG